MKEKQKKKKRCDAPMHELELLIEMGQVYLLRWKDLVALVIRSRLPLEVMFNIQYFCKRASSSHSSDRRSHGGFGRQIHAATQSRTDVVTHAKLRRAFIQPVLLFISLFLCLSIVSSLHSDSYPHLLIRRLGVHQSADVVADPACYRLEADLVAACMQRCMELAVDLHTDQQKIHIVGPGLRSKALCRGSSDTPGTLVGAGSGVAGYLFGMIASYPCLEDPLQAVAEGARLEDSSGLAPCESGFIRYKVMQCFETYKKTPDHMEAHLGVACSAAGPAVRGNLGAARCLSWLEAAGLVIVCSAC